MYDLVVISMFCFHQDARRTLAEAVMRWSNVMRLRAQHTHEDRGVGSDSPLPPMGQAFVALFRATMSCSEGAAGDALNHALVRTAVLSPLPPCLLIAVSQCIPDAMAGGG